MKSISDLIKQLANIEGKGYPAYKTLQGEYRFAEYELSIDHVQGDPFASPSKFTVSVALKTAGFPEDYYDVGYKRIMLQDYLTREFGRYIRKFSGKAKGSGKSGDIRVSHCSQQVLERTACGIMDGKINMRFEVGLPAMGRRVLAMECKKIIMEFIPECVKYTLFYKNQDKKRLKQAIELSEDQNYLRKYIKENELVAFVADGAILPRESGISGKPMKDAVPFASPESMKVEVELPNKGKLTGMGIRKGVTLIVGGGYHGKSTLLKALEVGVYNHINGDGREYVVTDDATLKLRAEDGRSIQNVDVSFFINHLPNGKDTRAFSTEDASGSTSQAANVMEGMEAGSSCFLIDEDTSATNFMLRDDLMQRVIAREKEPITPYVERVRQIYEDFGISTVMVAGSSGAYFYIADVIVQMDSYVPKDITDEVREICKNYNIGDMDFHLPYQKPDWNRIPTYRGKSEAVGVRPDRERMKVKVMGRDTVAIGKSNVDMRYVEQIMDSEQLAALGHMMKYAIENKESARKNVRLLVDEIFDKAEENGMLCFCGKKWASMAMPRKQELFALMNRFREKSLFALEVKR